jgi:hypothetical protein
VIHNGTRLTTRQRKALVFAVAHGINPRKLDELRIRQRTLDELEALGLVRLMHNRKHRPTWRATDVGRGLVAATGLTPRLLSRSSVPAYASDPARCSASRRRSPPGEAAACRVDSR